MPDLVEKSVALLAAKRQRPAAEISAEVIEFIRLRLLNLLTGQSYPQDVVDAVLTAAFVEPVDAVERVKALAALKGREDFEPLSVAFKRVGNIIKGGLVQSVNPTLFEADCEKVLCDKLEQVQTQVAELVAGRDYPAALEAIAGLRGPVDALFDGVMVMAKDEAVKKNRLALLTQISGLFKGVADFSRIA
jgi:glycyl-tRNA synthetase beta chain